MDTAPVQDPLGFPAAPLAAPALTAAVLLAASLAWAAEAPFTPRQIAFLTGPQDSALENVRFVSRCFAPEPTALVKRPQWLDESLPALSEREVWRLPDGEALSEARVWREPAAALADFFVLTRRSFPPPPKKKETKPHRLLKDFRGIRDRFQLALSRLHRAGLYGSLGGRGRGLISAYDKLLRDMSATANALRKRDVHVYSDSVMAAGAQTRSLKRILRGPPPEKTLKDGKKKRDLKKAAAKSR